MKLKTSVAAVILAFSATGAWAGATDQSKTELGGPEDPAVQPSGTAHETLEWKFVNGNPTGPESQAGGDRAAAPQEQSDTGQSAMTEGQDESDRSAMSEEQSSDDQAVRPDDDGRTEQSATSEGESESEQAAATEDEDESDRSANSDQPAADLRDKVVVIIPKGWKGSVPDLIAALEASPDAKDIVVVHQDEPQAGNEPGDEYQASKMPVVNQQ